MVPAITGCKINFKTQNITMRIASYVTILTSTVLLLCSVLGVYTNLGHYSSKKAKNNYRLSENIVNKTPNIKKLNKIAKKQFIPNDASKREIATGLFEIVSLRFSNGNRAEYNIFNNWVMGIFRYIPFEIAENFITIHNPYDLVRFGHTALCDKQASVLLTLMNKNGVKGRIVGLNGHVVMEAYYDDSWHMYDPNQEVYVTNNSTVLPLSELEKINKSFLKKYYRSDFISIIKSADNNHPLPPNTMSNSPDYAQLQYYSHYLKWGIPLFFLIVSVLFINKNSKINKE